MLHYNLIARFSPQAPSPRGSNPREASPIKQVCIASVSAALLETLMETKLSVVDLCTNYHCIDRLTLGAVSTGALDKAQYTKFGLLHAVQEMYGDRVAGAFTSGLSRLLTVFLQARPVTRGPLARRAQARQTAASVQGRMRSFFLLNSNSSLPDRVSKVLRPFAR